MQACGNTSYWLSAKLYLLRRVFMINLLNFLSLRGFLSKLSDNRVNILQVYLSLHETVSSFLVFFYR